MGQNPRWFYPEQLRKEANRWLQAIDRGDNVAVIFFPKADRARRLDQFLNDPSIRTYKVKKKIVFFTPSLEMIDDIEELQDNITRQLNAQSMEGKTFTFNQWIAYLEANAMRLVLVLPEAEKLLNPYGKNLFDFLTAITLKFEEHLSVMTLFEANLGSPSNAQFLSTNTKLIQSLFYYPLYEEEDARVLLDYLQKRWKSKMSKADENRIFDLCGGHPWLIAEAARLFAENGKFSFQDESMVFKIQTILSALNKQEQSVLGARIFKNATLSPEEKMVFKYLERLRLFDKKGKCTIGCIEKYLKDNHVGNQSMKLISGKIVLSGVSVDSLFSPKERRVIKLLLGKLGAVVSRDEIAKQLWPTNTDEHYSDWAIDQIVTRIRKRFTQLSLPTSMLKVVRGRGYALNQP